MNFFLNIDIRGDALILEKKEKEIAEQVANRNKV